MSRGGIAHRTDTTNIENYEHIATNSVGLSTHYGRDVVKLDVVSAAATVLILLVVARLHEIRYVTLGVQLEVPGAEVILGASLVLALFIGCAAVCL